jgi:lipoyl(octanoyl) transferase
VIFDDLLLWADSQERSGPENMAMDDWLLESSEKPVLRVYRWRENWGSLGYFGKIAEARATFPEVKWVRRWTGGGIVDHRSDWTYTVIAPAREPVSKWKGVEIYRAIHQALAQALAEEGTESSLSNGSQETGAADCFSNPVGFDLVDSNGRKIAGAGQRRGKFGLLYQGSLAMPCGDVASEKRSVKFAKMLSNRTEKASFEAPDLSAKIADRYAQLSWTGKR